MFTSLDLVPVYVWWTAYYIMNKEENQKRLKDIINHLERKFIQSDNEQDHVDERHVEEYRKLPLD